MTERRPGLRAGCLPSASLSIQPHCSHLCLCQSKAVLQRNTTKNPPSIISPAPNGRSKWDIVDKPDISHRTADLNNNKDLISHFWLNESNVMLLYFTQVAKAFFPVWLLPPMWCFHNRISQHIMNSCVFVLTFVLSEHKKDLPIKNLSGTRFN